MDGAGDRLDEHGLLVAQLIGYDVQLAAVCGELLAPPSTGVGAETGLETRFDVADGDPVAAVGETGPARVAQVDSPGGTLQDRVDDDPGAGGEVVAVGEQLSHRLVTGHQGKRHQS